MEIEALERRLDKLIGWRKKEILSVRADAKSATGLQQLIFLRCLTFLTYAHWEGFVKQSAVLYFEFIMSKKKTYIELDENFVAVAISKRASGASVKPSYYHDVAHFLRYDQTDLATLSTPSVLSDMGMLTSERLTTILYCLAMQVDTFELKFKWLDYSFIDKRNKVAHGEFTAILPTEITDYLNLAEEGLELIESFRSNMLSAAHAKSYERKPIPFLSGERY
jgi:hypothetical protein